jgi:hypothetical protein
VLDVICRNTIYNIEESVMHMALIMLGSVGLMLGSIAAGILSCWLLWSAFKLLGHPEWGPPIILLPAILALTGQLPANEFLVLTMIFASLAIMPFCAEGLAWRARRGGRLETATPGQEEKVLNNQVLRWPGTYRRYPAIVGCVGEGRPPNPGEVKKVASRMLQEGLVADRRLSGVAKKRAALRAAKVALNGS